MKEIPVIASRRGTLHAQPMSTGLSIPLLKRIYMVSFEDNGKYELPKSVKILLRRDADSVQIKSITEDMR